MYLQSDIVLVQFPFTDLSGSKLRPALIISCKKVNSLRDLVCIQITSKKFDDELFMQIENSDLTIPLKLSSGIRIHKIFTVHELAVVRKISAFTPPSFEKLMKEISVKVLRIDY